MQIKKLHNYRFFLTMSFCSYPNQVHLFHLHTQDLLKRTHIHPRKIIECSSPEELMMMVNSGVGVALMSRFAMLDQFPDIKTIDVKDSDALYLELIWLKDSNNTLIEKFVHKMFTFYH